MLFLDNRLKIKSNKFLLFDEFINIKSYKIRVY